MTPCIWPTGEHFWSIPQPDGTQTCLWCSATQQSKPPTDQGSA
ncbi:hypothetical protein LJR143_001649 [Pseudoxanthomonas sp. LjRoot143]